MTNVAGLPDGVFILWCGRRPVPVSRPPETIPKADRDNICSGRSRFDVRVDVPSGILPEDNGDDLPSATIPGSTTFTKQLGEYLADPSLQFEEFQKGEFRLKDGIDRNNIVFADNPGAKI